MKRTATTTSAFFRLREFRTIAGLLLKRSSHQKWNQIILEQNVLQLGSPESIEFQAYFERG
jgi:hypothetical protein